MSEGENSYQEAAVLLPTSGDIHKSEKNTFGVDTHGIVKISSHAFPHKYSSNVSSLDFGEDCRNRLDRLRSFFMAKVQSRPHNEAQSESSTGKQKRKIVADRYSSDLLLRQKYGLFSVFVRQISRQVRLQLAVIGMNRRTERSLGRTALSDLLQDAFDVTHSVRIVDIGDRRQRFRIGDISLCARKLQKAAFQDVQRNILLRLE
jgi:hypothetical protein